MLQKQCFQELQTALLQGNPAVLSFGPDKACKRLFQPQARLILLGGGHVSHALSQLAAMLEFDLVVVDDRAEFACQDRFPTASSILCAPFADAILSLHITASDYVCVLTRGHSFDELCIRTLLAGTFPAYLGMIGSLRRIQGMMELLLSDGYPEHLLKQIHAPIGLPIGSQSPAEIAISIAAQLIKQRSLYRKQAQEQGILPVMSAEQSVLACLANETASAVAIIVETSGSSPAKPGALMAVFSDGSIAGTIGGGIGEEEVRKQAYFMLQNHIEQKTVSIDMTGEVAAAQGMVCGGRMKVWIELIS